MRVGGTLAASPFPTHTAVLGVHPALTDAPNREEQMCVRVPATSHGSRDPRETGLPAEGRFLPGVRLAALWLLLPMSADSLKWLMTIIESTANIHAPPRKEANRSHTHLPGSAELSIVDWSYSESLIYSLLNSQKSIYSIIVLVACTYQEDIWGAGSPAVWRQKNFQLLNASVKT